VPPTADSLPDDIATLKAMVIATRIACLEAEAKARNAEAEVRVRELLIEQMKFTIAKLKHERYGQSSERGAALEQLELRLADLEEDASQVEAAGRRQVKAAQARRSRSRRSSGVSRRAGRCRSICRASVLSIRHRRPARAAAVFCTSSGRT